MPSVFTLPPLLSTAYRRDYAAFYSLLFTCLFLSLVVQFKEILQHLQHQGV